VLRRQFLVHEWRVMNDQTPERRIRLALRDSHGLFRACLGRLPALTLDPTYRIPPLKPRRLSRAFQKYHRIFQGFRSLTVVALSGRARQQAALWNTLANF
jgi:hypothetical protein